MRERGREREGGINKLIKEGTNRKISMNCHEEFIQATICLLWKLFCKDN